jgi:hypothetical protein
MAAAGTIHYRWASPHERRAFALLVAALGLELDDVRPAPASDREPVRFWLDSGTRQHMRDLSRCHGVADSTIFRLAFVLGYAAICEAIEDRAPPNGHALRFEARP